MALSLYPSASEMILEQLIQANQTEDSEVDAELLQSAMTLSKEIIVRKEQTIPTLETWLSLLIHDCRIGNRDDWSKYLNLVSKLSAINNQVIKQWIQVHQALAENEVPEHSGLLLKVQEGLETHSTLLNAIAELFNYKPYPDKEKFIAALAKEKKKLKSIIDQFDRDPPGIREPLLDERGQPIKSRESVFLKQFDTSQVHRVIAKIFNLLDREGISAELQYQLAQQVIYINAVGKDHPMMVRDKTYTNLTQLSRAELRELSKVLIGQIRAPILGEHTQLSKLKAQLNLLAVMREHHYRITKQFIDTTLLTSILMSLNTGTYNLLVEIDQEEKRSIAMQFFAVMQWIENNGGTVDVCCANQELVSTNYLKKEAKAFFSVLDIPSAPVKNNDPAGTYQVGGINYTTTADLALYRSRAEKENENLTHHSALPCSLIINGTDFNTLNNQRIFDFYKRSGRIVALFGKTGLTNGWTKQCSKLGIQIAYKIPSHNLYQRKELYPDYPAISPLRLKKIRDIIAQAPSGQPMVLLTQDAYQVEQLFKELSKQFAREGKEVQLGAFTGDESEEKRQIWIENQAGKPNTITISTYLLTKGFTFNTQYEKGFLGIHTDIETPNKTKKFIERIIPPNKSGEYIVIYEDNGLICSNSWIYQIGQPKNNLIENLSKIYRQQNQKVAIENYYIQAVSTIQLAVHQQLDEWHAFLHYLYPEKKWKELDKELLIVREELNLLLEEEWNKCLKNYYSDSYPINSAKSRDKNRKAKIASLDRILKEYEQVISVIWKKKQKFLKEKTEDRIQKDSVDALRYHFLQNVSLEERLKCIQLAARQKRKKTATEKKEIKRMMIPALDVHGSMLAYADIPKEPYRGAFAKNQVQLLITDIIKIINSASLSPSSKSALHERLKGVDNFLALAAFLNNYFDLFDSANLIEKYRMQPIINELFKAYEYSGLQFTEALDLEILKNTYIDNVAFDLVNHLEQSLAWALENNREGLEYWIERTAVKQAAHELLIVVSAIKNATDNLTRQKGIRDLYKLLAHHQAQLDGLWIFSFGHKNTRDLINHTLKTLDTLTVIGSGHERLDTSFIEECKEHAYSDVLKAKFNIVVEKLEHKNSSCLLEHPQWKKIKQQMELIQSDNKTVYVIDELYYFLSKKSKELNVSHLPSDAFLFKRLIELRGKLRIIWDKFFQSHREMISETNHWKSKAGHIKNNLQGLKGYTVKNVALHRYENGFHEYFDLLIEGTGSCPLLDGFLIYNSQFTDLDQKYRHFLSQKEEVNTQFKILQQLQEEQLVEFHSKKDSSLDIELFPLDCRNQVEELCQLKNMLQGDFSNELKSLFPECKEVFQDKELVEQFQVDTLNKTQIDQVKDKKLREEFINLYNKMNGLSSQQTWSLFSKVISYVLSPFVSKEKPEDWAHQLAVLKKDPMDKIKVVLQSKIKEKLEELSIRLNSLACAVNKKATLLEDKIQFLQHSIYEEKTKSKLIIKRFESLDEVYDFEITLRNYKAGQNLSSLPAPVPIKKDLESVDIEPSIATSPRM